MIMTRRVNVGGSGRGRLIWAASLLLMAGLAAAGKLPAGESSPDDSAPEVPAEAAAGAPAEVAPEASAEPAPEAPAEVGPEAPERPRQTRADACRVPAPGPEQDPEDEEWIDRFQQGIYTGVCGTANWFDGLFGTPRYDQDSNDTFGRIALFETWDDRDGLDTRLRLRARLALPAMRDRLRLTLGRGDERELVENRPANSENPLPPSFRRVNDDAWLLGLGYSRQEGLENGFDFGVGIRLRFPVDPFVRGTYRHNFIIDESTMLRFRETLFWRDTRGFGATTQLSLDRLLTDALLVRWNNTGTIAEDTEGLDWGSSVTLFQSLGNRRALAYTVLVRGETAADVGLQDYGVDLRYRRRLNRRWLFLELATSLTWPRETLEERRKINPGVGIGVEMYFGPVPDDQLR
jgi:hypothetical protein